MKIADHIRHTLDATDQADLERAMLHVCLAVDGTAKKTHPTERSVGRRFRQFIIDNLDIVELMHGGMNLQETIFPFRDSRGGIGVKFEDIVYEKYRCSLAHGDELPDGYGINVKLEKEVQRGSVDTANQAITLPESAIYALGLPCVLAPVNADQRIGDNRYHFHDPINSYVVDRWWGLRECARKIMDFDSQVRVKMDFSAIMPRA